MTTQETFGDYVDSLPSAPSLGGSDGIYVLQGGVSKQISGSTLTAAFPGASAFDTVASLQAATVASSLNTVKTNGYYAAGDGGGATYKRTSPNANPGHAYSVQSADGTWWVYVPEAAGWNARVAGVKADGVADDTTALQNAFLPFSSPTKGPLGGLGLTGRLLLPDGLMLISRPVWYVGDSSRSIHILGQSVGSGGGGAGTCLLWNGILANSWPTMFYLRSANRCIVEGINFKGLNGVGLLNLCVHMSDNVFNTTLSSPVTAGIGVTATPASMTNIEVGSFLGIGQGSANFEIVLVTGTGGGSFTASFQNNHNASEVVGNGPGTSGTTFRDCNFNTTTNAAAVGLFCGNNTAVSTPQVSEVKIKNCHFGPITGVDGDTFAAINVQGGGNVSNYSIDHCAFQSCKYSVIYAGGPTCQLFANASGGTTVAEVSGTYCHIDSWECESPGAFLLQGTSGYATISNSRYNCTSYPANNYAVSFTAANLTLIGNNFGQSGVSGVCKIQAGQATTNQTSVSAGQVTSIGNYYANAGPSNPVFFDGSNNALYWGNQFATANKTRMFSVGDFGDNGQLYSSTGQLTSVQGGPDLASGAVVSGATVKQASEIGLTTSLVTVPFSVFQIAGLTKQVNICGLPAKTRLVSVIADVTTTFGGTAGTLNLSMEVSSTADVLTAFDCKSATVQKGMAATDLGTNLTTAANLPPGGYVPSWSSETFLKSTLVSGTGNLSGLTQGSVNFYVTVSRFNPS